MENPSRPLNSNLGNQRERALSHILFLPLMPIQIAAHYDLGEMAGGHGFFWIEAHSRAVPTKGVQCMYYYY